MKNFLKYLLATIVGIFISCFLLFLLMVIIIASSASEKPVEIKANTILLVELNEQIVERCADNPLNYLPGSFAPARQIGLNDILENIKKAKEDENIAGIFMELSYIRAGISTVEEIRNAILDFRESGKFVISYGDIYTQKAYYLASASEKVYINPAGDISFTGLASSVMFFKGALDKLGIEVEIIRHGDFKSAVEPFMNRKMSEESRKQTLIWVGSIWKQMLSEISASRGISVEELNKHAENLAISNPSQALELRLVDGLRYKDEIINELKEKTNTADKDDLASITLRKYTKVPDKHGKGYSRDKIAVVYAYGDVLMGESGEGTISSERISKALRQARRDSTVKAIVFRINSGGGSALASEIIWREMDLASQVKPVVASFGDVAASGGYYIAAPADTIMALPVTITGSVGVFGLLPNVEQFLDKKLGITHDVAKTNRSADFGSFYRPITPDERMLIEQAIERIYADFVGHVAEGRHMSLEKVDELGQGKVWSGSNALENGLIDLHGGLFKAIELAAKMASVEKYRVTSLPKLEDPIEELLKSLTENAQVRFIKARLGENYRYLEQLNKLQEYSGIQARIPYYFSID
jgi:protease-4